MLYHIYAESLYESRKSLLSKTGVVNDYEQLKELLEKSNHTFLVILTRSQIAIEELFKKYGLLDYKLWDIADTGEKYIHNQNYVGAGNPRRLNMFTLQGKGDSSAT